MQKLFRIIMLMLAIALVACGGGGGSPGGNPNQPILYTTAPASIFLAIGSSQEYTITGGIPPYNVVNGDKNIAIGGIRGDSLTIGATSAGQTTVAILDNIGTKVTINVKAGADFVTSAPSSVTVGIGAIAAQTFGLSGGAAPYTAVSSDTSVATVTVSETRLTITGLVPGFTEIIARDATGFERKIFVTVQSAVRLFTTANSPVNISMGASGARTFTIGGGTAPYTTSSSNAGFVSAVVNGNSLFITGNAVGNTTVTVRDSAGATVPISITVSSVSPLFTTADGPISVFPGATGARNFTIGGGTAPYSASSSNAGIVSVSVNGNNLVITGLVVSPNSVNVTVRDDAGGTVVIPVTVANVVPLYVNAPSAITLGVGAALAQTYEIGGGTAPYTTVSSNTGVIKASIIRTSLLVEGVVVGSGLVQVRDAQGAVVNLAVTVAVGQGLPLYTTAASSITLSPDQNQKFSIAGGSTPYTATSSNTNVATTSVLGDQLTITAGVSGKADIRVGDSTGNFVIITVNVTALPGIAMTVQPVSATGNVGDVLEFLLQNGIPSYIVTVNNPTVAIAGAPTVNSTGTSIKITLRGVGSTKITVTDSRGQTVSFDITVSQTQTASLSLAPSAFEIGEDAMSPLVLSVVGGTGNYRAFTSDLGLSNVTVAGNNVTVGLGSRGTRCVNPIDTNGVYIPRGPFEVILTIVDTGGAFATSKMTIRDNGLGAGGCGIFTPPNLIDMAFAASGLDTNVLSGATRTYTITGGTAPYTAEPQTSTQTIATGLVIGNVLTINGIGVGVPTTVTVRDSAGVKFPVRVTVTAP